MQLHSFDDWMIFRRRSLVRDYTEWQPSRRGEYHSLGAHAIYSSILPMKLQNDKFRAIVNCEVGIAWNGTDSALSKDLYANDGDLLNAYKSLHLEALLNVDKHSRNAVVINKQCCCCLWQRIDGVLIVYSRSMDIRSAGKSDCFLVSEIARRLGVTDWLLICAQVHIYKDTTIARRTK
jgi:hypothetical protein